MFIVVFLKAERVVVLGSQMFYGIRGAKFSKILTNFQKTARAMGAGPMSQNAFPNHRDNRRFVEREFSSRAKVTDQDARYDPRFDFVVNEPEGKGRDTNFLATVLEQRRLYRIAAIYTALAILFQAAASSPLIESWIRR